jgi:D-arabinose 1-dehydrogenase-like Zn-dependent alcohol dehydrogenase
LSILNLFGVRSIAATMTGARDRCGGHAFLPLQQIRPMIETVPRAYAAEAYGRMMRNEVRFRIVLVTDL